MTEYKEILEQNAIYMACRAVIDAEEQYFAAQILPRSAVSSDSKGATTLTNAVENLQTVLHGPERSQTPARCVAAALEDVAKRAFRKGGAGAAREYLRNMK